ncbi:myogenesis-regulating glycosidase-like [Saccostrea echinata]|uniref:myogenesis-regulating glycosidase-like n=1 Tax=Saccostrea echinata TaxID=191078 RepID=UPI002A83FECF|nr:myogenesis-regulating glycosidase-like [Saccostrea echinata]
MQLVPAEGMILIGCSVILFFTSLTLGSKYDEGKNRGTTKEYCDSENCGNLKRKLIYNEESISLSINENDEKFIEQFFPSTLKSLPSTDCRKSREDFCLTWGDSLKATMKKKSLKGQKCFELNFSSKPSSDILPTSCIPLEGAAWYGGAELHRQRWPLNDVSLPMQPFISNDIVPEKSAFGNVLEPYWINSKGVGLYVDDVTPLHVAINEKKSRLLCLQAKFQEPHFRRATSQYLMLNYTICKQRNVREIRNFIHDLIFDVPNKMPDKRMIKSPIWSTWARYKTLINQTKVLQFAEEIRHYGFSNSQIEIDDKFTTKYGDFDFDPDKFPDPLGMIQQLNADGFRTTVWMTPFANLDSVAFSEGLDKGYWLMDTSGKVPALVKWWQGIGGIIDVTNEEAVEWFVRRLREMQTEYQIDSFKFDAGEMTYLPSSYSTRYNLGNPGFFTTLYVDMVSRFGDMIEIRCGYKSQRHPVFVRMGDKESTWDYENGFKTLVPTVLTMGILGYPYILPDMIGGNGYGENLGIDVVLPEKELYIRWLQLTAYLPSMQFSFVPWDFDDEVVEIAKEMVKIHEEVVTPILLKASNEAQKSGAPLIRPLWWIEPEVDEALNCDDEFLVGDSLLVSPITDRGSRSRDIYIPRGEWRDNLHGNTITGPVTLRNYEVTLRQVATFELLDDVKF